MGGLCIWGCNQGIEALALRFGGGTSLQGNEIDRVHKHTKPLWIWYGASLLEWEWDLVWGVCQTSVQLFLCCGVRC